MAKKKVGSQTPEKPDGKNVRKPAKVTDLKDIGKVIEGGLKSKPKDIFGEYDNKVASMTLPDGSVVHGAPFPLPAKAALKDEEAQKPLFGEYDLIVNALELDERKIQAEIDRMYDSIGRTEDKIDGLKEWLAIVHKANVQAKKLGEHMKIPPPAPAKPKKDKTKKPQADQGSKVPSETSPGK